MSDKFEWQTAEDEKEWEALPPVAEKEKPSRRRWAVVPLVILLLVGLTGWMVYQQAAQRVQETTALVTRDILTTHTLIQQANTRRDTELFRTVLSGRDSHWTKAQEQLMAKGLLLDRAPLNLRSVPQTVDMAQAMESDGVDVTVSPELTAAEVVFDQDYLVQTAGVTETVTLQHTAVYRLGKQRWLLSPPDDDFWQGKGVNRGPLVTVRYPLRDREIADRLAFDLEELVGDLCQTAPQIDCPPDLQVELHLSNRPETLLAMEEWKTAAITGTLDLRLPTPTLVGLPQDEAAYQALYRGYAAPVLVAVVAEIVGYECCDQELLYRALLDKQLSALELRPWPLTTAVYQQLLLDGFYPQRFPSVWWATSSGELSRNWRRAYAFIDFLVERAAPEATLLQLQQQLAQSQSYNEWLDRLPISWPGGYDETGAASPFFNDYWLDFVLQKGNEGQPDSPPLPLPEQDVQLECWDTGTFSIYRYDSKDGTWSERELVENRPRYIRPAPITGGYYYTVQEERVDDETGEAAHLRLAFQKYGEQEKVFTVPAKTDEGADLYFVGIIDPTARYFVFSSNSSNRSGTQFWLLDTAACREGELCTAWEMLIGWPRWSPDGSQTLMMDASESVRPEDRFVPLYLGDARGQAAQEVARGLLPFWLDNETYAYIAQSEEAEAQIVVATVGSRDRQVALLSSELVTAVPAAEQSPELSIEWVAPSPVDINVWAVAAAAVSDDRQNYYFFLFERGSGQPGTISYLFRTSEFPSPAFSPDGRVLTSVERANNRSGNANLVRFLNLETGNTTVATTNNFWISWSAGGQWVVQAYDRYMLMMAPSYNYLQFVPHQGSNCYGALWVEREGNRIIQ